MRKATGAFGRFAGPSTVDPGLLRLVGASRFLDATYPIPVLRGDDPRRRSGMLRREYVFETCNTRAPHDAVKPVLTTSGRSPKWESR